MLHHKLKSHFLSLGFQAVCSITQSIPSGTIHLVQSCILSLVKLVYSLTLNSLLSSLSNTLSSSKS